MSLSRQEIFERKDQVLDDAKAFARAFRYLRQARAGMVRSGARDLTWRDAENALHGQASTLVTRYERAVAALARKAAA